MDQEGEKVGRERGLKVEIAWRMEPFYWIKPLGRAVLKVHLRLDCGSDAHSFPLISRRGSSWDLGRFGDYNQPSDLFSSNKVDYVLMMCHWPTTYSGLTLVEIFTLKYAVQDMKCQKRMLSLGQFLSKSHSQMDVKGKNEAHPIQREVLSEGNLRFEHWAQVQRCEFKSQQCHDPLCDLSLCLCFLTYISEGGEVTYRTSPGLNFCSSMDYRIKD